MLIKLDMENSFDRVKLSFLYKVLLSLVFSPEFVYLIKACTDKPWIALLVSGRPVSYFQGMRGLRQGCSLSPFLYILMVDMLCRKLTVENIARALHGIIISNDMEPINHSLFEDDSLLLGGASMRISKVFNSILHNYCSVSSALINENKSAVYGWNIKQHDLQYIAQHLGFAGYAH